MAEVGRQIRIESGAYEENKNNPINVESRFGEDEQAANITYIE